MKLGVKKNMKYSILIKASLKIRPSERLTKNPSFNPQESTLNITCQAFYLQTEIDLSVSDLKTYQHGFTVAAQGERLPVPCINHGAVLE